MGFSQSKSAEIVPYNPALNPYRARHYWPPDLSKLSPKHQFRLERKYKRRCAQKSFVNRPKWQKGTMLANLFVCSGVAIYGILFMDWGDPDREGFQEIREWVRGTTNSIWTQSARDTLPRAGEGPHSSKSAGDDRS